jgi:hypothetical protein
MELADWSGKFRRRVAASEGSAWPFVTAGRNKPSLLAAGCGRAGGGGLYVKKGV